jgi:hypothetical protein
VSTRPSLLDNLEWKVLEDLNSVREVDEAVKLLAMLARLHVRPPVEQRHEVLVCLYDSLYKLRVSLAALRLQSRFLGV